jgi:hypothetical protein
VKGTTVFVTQGEVGLEGSVFSKYNFARFGALGGRKRNQIGSCPVREKETGERGKSEKGKVKNMEKAERGKGNKGKGQNGKRN